LPFPLRSFFLPFSSPSFVQFPVSAGPTYCQPVLGARGVCTSSCAPYTFFPFPSLLALWAPPSVFWPNLLSRICCLRLFQYSAPMVPHCFSMPVFNPWFFFFSLFFSEIGAATELRVSSTSVSLCSFFRGFGRFGELNVSELHTPLRNCVKMSVEKTSTRPPFRSSSVLRSSLFV